VNASAPTPVTSCTGCAACCRAEAQPPFLSTELDRLPPALAAGLSEHASGLPGESIGPCPWLSADGACRHYEDRPGVCREFEMGGEECLRVRGGK
jgi:Fe-S-cluster containining protein